MSELQSLRQHAISVLNSKSESATLDVDLLLASVLNTTRASLYANPKQEISNEQEKTFEALFSRRLKGEPMAYILGKKEFWSLELIVTPDTLIPRPETELLVETALKLLPNDEALSIADVGTGTGAIALSLAEQCPLWQIDASDVSEKALAVAKKNAERLGLDRVNFYCGEWLQPFPKNSYSAIISNPPYIAEGDEHLTLGDVAFEPRLALVSGKEGLTAIATLIQQAPFYLADHGWLLLEHGFQQGSTVRQWMQEAGFSEVHTQFDLSGHERVTGGLFLKHF
ncbi:MAG: peptide chain release factor N(5)-glutamine methyltransferase [Proteobacteria bacterium]|nr:peptide chain release factor N(5)-glutamine methyltransferase [Pseudomonadota bacterium]